MIILVTMDYITKTNLILPFSGVLMVSNGGRSPETNNHNRPSTLGPQNQLYAYDFRDDYTGIKDKLESYSVYGLPVISPANGVVIQVINGSIDCNPGEIDRSVGVGNTVIIDHRNGEFSVLCHLKYQTIKVSVGDSVKQGQVIGLCGNTGNTSQPHIHYHLQDQPLMHKAKALLAQFGEIVVDGEIKKNNEPIRFQHVSNI
jgi:murein DD-endopeptidase MepM/ murein hydrolase activator NlpD